MQYINTLLETMIDISTKIIRGRGAQINPHNRFEDVVRSDEVFQFDDDDLSLKTKYIKVHPKTIVNKVDSPDIPFQYSMNPYQGCEHGCVYCYARNSHNYWGYSSGVDFERVILVKESAPQLLEKILKKKTWKVSPIMLSGNTDCYQPIERKLRITREILKTLNKYKHPVSIITKNALILRDLDILKELNKDNLVSVTVSLNTLSNDTRARLEPRTSTVEKRLEIIKNCSERNIPVTLLMAPVIPGLTDHEIMPLVAKAAENGASSLGHITVRLNGTIGQIFEDWVKKSFPDRASKILNKIASLHRGKLNNSVYGERMKGSGNIADMIHQQFNIAVTRYYPDGFSKFAHNLDMHEKFKSAQLSLF